MKIHQKEVSKTKTQTNFHLGDLLEDLLQKVKLMELAEDHKNFHTHSKWSNIKTIEDLAEYIKSGDCKNIAILCGAGLSTPCGIPDFRSPETGIFSNLEEYNLPYPEAMFDCDYFQENPNPFYDFSRKILKNLLEAKPSKAHYFIKLLENKNLLTRVYSQNIDSLEEKAGVDEKLVCCVHGSLKRAYCIECRHAVETDSVITQIMNKQIPKCPQCSGLVKPAIVFYGEPLPKDFENCLLQDQLKIDLLIIMGTSLTVYPVSYVADVVKPGIPRLLLNKTIIGKFLPKPDLGEASSHSSSSSWGMERHVLNKNGRYQDVFYQGTCDSGCLRLIELLGWQSEFQALLKDSCP